MRTLEELRDEALTMRAGFIEVGKDPLLQSFAISMEEHCLLKMQPYHCMYFDHSDDRLCGLKVKPLHPRTTTGQS